MQAEFTLKVDYEDEDGEPLEDEKTLNRLKAGVLYAIEMAIDNGALTAGSNGEINVGQYWLGETREQE